MGKDIMNKTKTKGDTPAELIDARITEVGGWRGTTLSQLRALIKQANGAQIVKLRAFTAGTGDMRRVHAIAVSYTHLTLPTKRIV